LVLGYLADAKIPTEDTIVYACGHPGMIEDLREKLTDTGYAYTEERFWKDDD